MGRFGVPKSAYLRKKHPVETPKKCEADPNCPNFARKGDEFCDNHAFWRQKAKDQAAGK